MVEITNESIAYSTKLSCIQTNVVICVRVECLLVFCSLDRSIVIIAFCWIACRILKLQVFVILPRMDERNNDSRGCCL